MAVRGARVSGTKRRSGSGRGREATRVRKRARRTTCPSRAVAPARALGSPWTERHRAAVTERRGGHPSADQDSCFLQRIRRGRPVEQRSVREILRLVSRERTNTQAAVGAKVCDNKSSHMIMETPMTDTDVPEDCRTRRSGVSETATGVCDACIPPGGAASARQGDTRVSLRLVGPGNSREDVLVRGFPIPGPRGRVRRGRVRWI